MDLSHLIKPIIIGVPRIGEVSMDVMGEPFEPWLARGIKEGRWTTGEALVRGLLREQGRVVTGHAQAENPELGEPPTAGQVNALNDAELDTLAASLLVKAKGIFRPQFEAIKGKKVQYRRKAELESLTQPLADESNAARLLRLTTLKAEDVDLRQAKLRQDSEAHLPPDSVRSAIEIAAGLEPILKAQKLAGGLGAEPYGIAARASALSRLSDPLSGSASAILDAARGSRLGATFQAAEAVNRLTHASRISDVYPGVLAASLSAMNADTLSGTTRALRDLELSGLASGALRDAIGAGIGRDHWDVLKRSGVLSATVNAGLIAAAAAAISSTALEPSWLSAINARAGLHLPSSTLDVFDRYDAMARDIGAGSGVARPAVLDAYLRPGWELTSLAVLSGASASAGSALLTTYDDALDDDAPLGRVMADLHALDTAKDLSAEEAAAIVDRGAAALIARLGTTADVLGRHGVVSLIGVAAGVVGAVLAGAALLDHSHDDAMLRESRKQSENVQIIASSQNAIRRKLSELQASEAASLDARRVSSSTALRIGPDRDETRILQIYPDQRLRAVEERGEWVRVEVYHYGRDDIAIGWVERRLLIPF
ncbi:MAG: hypothetical protein JHC96_16390 [Brevundimonas sp.]|uniref:SH3 domain-containing protein n=1 Tax=Brevundimonas mediterranea TaxID=74329 RepID=A0A7Z9C5E9_9CAUL|nr:MULTISPECIES: SH3 domain-containing protein [Brevundimonas]MBJ7320367.1 hypothetical protein [Brevundimonas sp.]VDC49786.1 hypothetical protein BREV_BREV_01432 [Brevundimonas mediterranea]